MLCEGAVDLACSAISCPFSGFVPAGDVAHLGCSTNCLDMLDRTLNDIGCGDPVGNVEHEPAALLVPWTGGDSWQVLLGRPDRVDATCPGVVLSNGFCGPHQPIGRSVSVMSMETPPALTTQLPLAGVLLPCLINLVSDLSLRCQRSCAASGVSQRSYQCSSIRRPRLAALSFCWAALELSKNLAERSARLACCWWFSRVVVLSSHHLRLYLPHVHVHEC